MAFKYTGRIKHYPSGAWELLTASRPLWADQKQTRPVRVQKPDALDTKLMFEFDMIDGPTEGGLVHTVGEDGARLARPGAALENLKRAVRRAAVRVRDIALCTPFQYFVTLTLDKAKVNRYDMGEITKVLNNWLSNQVRNHGLSYVLVPERHKDGAVHFHGFFNKALDVVDSGHKDCKGHTIYNLPAWTLGFTTAIELYGDYENAVFYVCKYVGKQINGGGWRDSSSAVAPGAKIGGRWYYSGGKLGAPEVEYCDVTNEDAAEMKGAFSFEIEAAALSLVLVRGSNPKEEHTRTENDSKGKTTKKLEVEHENGRKEADGSQSGLPMVGGLQGAQLLEMPGIQAQRYNDS